MFIYLVIGHALNTLYAQPVDTLSGFSSKNSGEEIVYFSPLHRFATTALLTRANGLMPISFRAPIQQVRHDTVVYEILIGHSTGTSTGNRRFDVALNNHVLFTITTPMHQHGYYTLEGRSNEGCSYQFVPQEFDINGDAFGFLYLKVPAGIVSDSAVFKIIGQDQQSRDWLMVFMYSRQLKIEAEPTCLVTRNEKLRQLNLYVDNPFGDSTSMQLNSSKVRLDILLKKGYNKISLPAYPPSWTGIDTLNFVVHGADTLRQIVELNSVRNFEFDIIHHSHNDIGYSHLQTDVERIQTENIRTALRWIMKSTNTKSRPIWHIESLWAVENFLSKATYDEKQLFVHAVKSGGIVLSANYANVLTGLCQSEEQSWNTEYARRLEQRYGFDIRSAMITDIPGITWTALASYTHNDVDYLALGPNYVQQLPDHGDRVGNFVRQQGDRPFYWKPDSTSDRKLLVWTAGKGYSYFHNISASDKQAAFESRISDYCNELTMQSYPFDFVQLHYTMNADNGPVDTNLCTFVDSWNQKYSSPQLVIANVNNLFQRLQREHETKLPVCYGEVSPYWEDGAYSTSSEEIRNRELAKRTLQMEVWARQQDVYTKNADAFYELHRDIVMFHEHTWGSWCSISDPDLSFTTDQWSYKKAFLDSAEVHYATLAHTIGYSDVVHQEVFPATKVSQFDFEIDPNNGGLKSILVNGQELRDTTAMFSFFQMIYKYKVDSMQLFGPKIVRVKGYRDDRTRKKIELELVLDGCSAVSVKYNLDKYTGVLTASWSIKKNPVREKESLHIAIPMTPLASNLYYGDSLRTLRFGTTDQLRGSNYDFICAGDRIGWKLDAGKVEVLTSGPNLFEVGSMTDEQKVKGARTWKSEPSVNTSTTFLYVLNNYWHTNYKADQEGLLEFSLRVVLRSN